MPSIKTVTVWTLDSEGEDHNSGTISWDGDELTCEPSGDKRLRNIMEEPVIGKGENFYYPRSDPEGWLSNLHWHYKSPYLRVGLPKESVDEGTGTKSLDIVRAARQLVHAGGSPGAGQVFQKAGKIWYVGSKTDPEEFQGMVEHLFGDVNGVSKVDYHQEKFPPRDKGWVMVYPKRHEWVGNRGISGYSWEDFTPPSVRSVTNEGEDNCGIAKGGFQPGNTCARGGGSPAGITHTSDIMEGKAERKSVSPKEHLAAVKKAKAKMARVTPPTEAEKAAAAEGLARLGANKYRRNLVGNTKDRAKRRASLMKEFGDGKSCPCVYCGIKIGEGTLEQDKILTTAQGGRYRMDNLVPSCSPCNKRRGDMPFTEAIKKVVKYVKPTENREVTVNSLPEDGVQVEAMTYESIEYDREPQKVVGVLSTRKTAWGDPPHCYVNGVAVDPATIKNISETKDGDT